MSNDAPDKPASGSPAGKPAPKARPIREVHRAHIDPHQAGWYNLGIAALMIVLVVLLIRGIWFSSF